MKNAQDIVKLLTLEEKASLCSGLDVWHTEPVERLGLEPIMMCDGPHGLRKQPERDKTVPAVCFPPAVTTASSWDRHLAAEIGAAIGDTCLAEGVSIILGPGANIKRSPLCGRNFEYFSEDPYAAGEMAGNYIKGVQSKGVGTSLKHFCLNNQETRRNTEDAIVDERAMREIYLTGFEKAVKIGRPWTLMCSYNLINGAYGSENHKTLTEILREEWGFDGLVMSDWGAVNDRPLGVQAGLDLEMPGPSPDNDKRIVKAVQEGKLSIEDLDKVVTRVVELILKGMHNKKHHYHYSRDAQHALARKAASESMVLLKNKGYSRKDKHGLLPINGKTTAVIGAFAKKPRYQGGGSSHINTIKVDNPFEELLKAGVAAEFAQGYLDEAPVKGIMGADKIPEGDADQALIAEAVKLARKKDIAIVFAGMPLSFESEGYDRRDMEMPKAHNALIEAVAAANPNTVVVLMCGSPVAMPWASKVKSILVAYLGGEAAGGAIADILSGKVNPSGKLSETWPVKLADNPSYGNFPGGHKAVYYKESIFTGYRFYDTAKLAPAYPFGHGLSYTSFEYSKLKLDKNIYRPSGFVRAQVTVKNTGKLYGAEVVELYVSAPRGSKVFRAKKELKGFEKIWLKPGEEKTIQFMLDTRSFAYYNTAVGGWAVEGGNYGIEVGSSSRDIRLKTKIEVEGGKRENLLKDVMQKADVYFDIKDAFKEGKGLQISDAAFKAIYGKALPKPDGEPDAPFTRSSSVEDVWSNPQARAALVGMLKKANSFYEIPDGPIPEKPPAGQEEAPLRAIALWSGGAISLDDVDELCAKLNMS